jgi:hypothetical protein
VLINWRSSPCSHQESSRSSSHCHQLSLRLPRILKTWTHQHDSPCQFSQGMTAMDPSRTEEHQWGWVLPSVLWHLYATLQEACHYGIVESMMIF